MRISSTIMTSNRNISVINIMLIISEGGMHEREISLTIITSNKDISVTNIMLLVSEGAWDG
jgi:hypothetical protein